MDEYLTVKQVAERADVAPGSVYRWLDDPSVPLDRHKTPTGRVLISTEQADAWIAARNTPIVVSVASSSPAAVSGIAS
ncbi:helix-turn-helix transcriptional regulator [Streptomyces sp. NPDC001781]